MANMMEYRGYHGSVEFSAEDGLLVGTVFGIRDSLHYHGASVPEITESFHSCIDTYLEICKKHNREPDKEYRGSFNVRITPELHRKAALEAEKAGISLNQLIQEAIEEKLTTPKYGDIVRFVTEYQSVLAVSASNKSFATARYSAPVQLTMS